MKVDHFIDVQTQSALFRNRAKRVHAMIIERARQAAKMANLDPNLLGIHPHNAMVDFRSGRPWKEVDYHYCRKSLYLQEKAWEPMRLAERYSSRIFQDFMNTKHGVK